MLAGTPYRYLLERFGTLEKTCTSLHSNFGLVAHILGHGLVACLKRAECTTLDVSLNRRSSVTTQYMHMESHAIENSETSSAIFSPNASMMRIKLAPLYVLTISVKIEAISVI